ncbi:MAG: 2-oxoacid:acceptor oxidoreductase family protein [Candidatus Bathyarchaeia archaeon]
MKIEVRISGLGGQGVVLAGHILGKAAVYDGKNAVQTQSYGAEARGSAAKSEVIISDSKIGFPVVRKSDILIAMSQQALEKHLKDLKENGVLIVDNTYVKKIPETTVKVFQIPATENAEKMFGAKVYANIIMLGALVKATNIVSEKAMQNAIKDTVTRKTVDTNKQAYKHGTQMISPKSIT